MTEQILVVSRKKLFGENDERAFTGFKAIEDADFTKIIKDNLIDMPRDEMENNPRYKQVIPYCVFVHDKRIFLYKRTPASGEPRLHDKYSIGVGGHMNPVEGDALIKGMRREFHEELSYDDDYSYKVIGFVNADETSVDKVHFAVIFMIEGKTPDIEVAEKDKLVGGLKDMGEVEEKIDLLENWSIYAFENIRERLVA